MTFEKPISVALVGNPNVGKSTVFNALTGSRQHTGNWPGKTVEVAQGQYTYKGKGYAVIDLPGTYSLVSRSEEEMVTAQYFLSEHPDCVVFVADASCLARGLVLVLQAMRFTDRAVLCVNLMDEAERNSICVDLNRLEKLLGVPVVGATASAGEGLDRLMEAVRCMADGFSRRTPVREAGAAADGLDDYDADVCEAERIAMDCVSGERGKKSKLLDKVTTGKVTGDLVLMLLLFGIFWLTIVGANFPSRGLEWCFAYLEKLLYKALVSLPDGLVSFLIGGVYHTAAAVVAVMLPPMAIFFPLFSLLEDFGYLTRAAFLTDHQFEKCGSCGKQALTMALGFGCNAVGVTGCRIIETPKVRRIAMLTNAFVPCNGRFPALIALAALLAAGNGLVETMLLACVVFLGVFLTFVASRLLDRTISPGEQEEFLMEMPPFRRPRVIQVICRSVKDKVLVVLGRAVSVAAPAGALLWLLETVQVDGNSLIGHMAVLLGPVGTALGVNGVVLTALLLSFPANELFLPLAASISGAGLAQMGWSFQTVLCTMVLVLLHWPCSTTILTIRKESGSWKWALISMVLPTAFGVAICMIINLFL